MEMPVAQAGHLGRILRGYLLPPSVDPPLTSHKVEVIVSWTIHEMGDTVEFAYQHVLDQACMWLVGEYLHGSPGVYMIDSAGRPVGIGEGFSGNVLSLAKLLVQGSLNPTSRRP